MIVFSTAVKDILKALEVQPDVPYNVSDSYNEFRQFVAQDTIDHNENMRISPESPIIQQILNTNDINQLEQILRVNLDYCDDCLLKLYRRFFNRK